MSSGSPASIKSWSCLRLPVVVAWFNIGFSPYGLTAAIQHHPQDHVAVLYQPAGFGVIAANPAPTYQWRKDGVIIPGATSDQFVLGRTRLFDAGVYSVIVSDGSGSVASADAELIVRLPLAGDLDNSFTSGASSFGGLAGSVTAIALQANGKLLIAISEEYGASYVSRLNADGTPDYTWMKRPEADSRIACIDEGPDGKIVIGGWFTRVGESSRGRIARLNADGSLDSSFQEGVTGANSLVRSVAVQTDGKVLCAGGFTTVSGTVRPYVARLSRDGTLDASFLSGQSGPNNSVSAIVLEDDGQILLGGGFTVVNNVTRRGIVRLNPDGSLDEDFLDGESGVGGASVSVSAITASDGKVVIAGAFTNVNDAARNFIARLNSDGTLDTSFVSRLSGADGSVTSVTITRDRRLLIGGNFSITNGLKRYNVALLNGDGTEESNFLHSVSGGAISSLAEQAGGQILIGGPFSSLSGVSRYNLARLHRNGDLDEAFNAPVGPNYSVACMAMQNDGRLVIGGIFSEVSGLRRNGIARLNADGTLDRTFIGAVQGNRVLSVAVQTDGKILVGGGAGAPRIMRLNVNGALDTTFLASANSTVESIAIQADGMILIGGWFTNVNGASRHGIARLHSNGNVDNGFLNGLAGIRGGSFPRVESVAVQGDGKILIGGSFSTVNGITRSNLARLNDNGTLDSNFLSAGSGASGPVEFVAVQSDSKVMIGGSFSRVNGEILNSIARLNEDGTLDDGFQSPEPGIGWVRSMFVQPDGRILVGGGWPAFILRLNADGTMDRDFQTVLGGPAAAWGGYTQNAVHAIALARDGRVLIGGDFSEVNGSPAPYLARLWSGRPPYIESISPPTGGSADIRLRLPAGSTNRVQYKNNLISEEWIDLPGELIQGATDGQTNKVDATSGTDGQRFYRVIMNPPP